MGIGEIIAISIVALIFLIILIVMIIDIDNHIKRGKKLIKETLEELEKKKENENE